MQVGAAGVTPVSTGEFAGRLAALGAPRRAIVAVSGGPDSMALMRLAASSGLEILTVTVDHGLRAASRAEAERTAGWCYAAGVQHRILNWEGPKPSTGVQAAARNARYRLLAELAEREGFDAILTGHTADDQAETVFMRLARGSGPAGLAGMDAETLIAAGAGEPVRLLRPLLGISRERVTATLRALGQEWNDDPSNDDPAYERVRTRALLGALEEQNLLTREALLRTAKRARAAAKRIEAAAADWFAAHGGNLHGAWVSLDDWKQAPPSVIARLIRSVSGSDFASTEEDAAQALASTAATGAATLGGAMLKEWRARLCIFREPAALLGRAGVLPMSPVELAPGNSVLWDGRFIISNRLQGASGTFRITPFGDRGSDEFPFPLWEGPPEALASAPHIEASGMEQTGGAARIESLLEERFSARVMRFP